MPRFIDVHTHAEFSAIKRALNAEIWLINVGTNKKTSAKAIEIAEKYPEGVYATAGLHPNDVNNKEETGFPRARLEERAGMVSDRGRTSERRKPASERAGRVSGSERMSGFFFDYDFYKNLAQNPKVVAIGECGLDYYRFKNEDLGFKNRQKDVFIKQIELAQEIKKPIMIHCRNAFVDLIDILKSYIINLKSSGVIHFFSGSKEDAKQLLELEFSFSFGGVITFARDYDEVIKYIPLERIVLETDAPYVAPVPYRGKRNEALYIVETAKKLAELKNVLFEEIARITTANAKRIFLLN